MTKLHPHENIHTAMAAFPVSERDAVAKIWEVLKTQVIDVYAKGYAPLISGNVNMIKIELSTGGLEIAVDDLSTSQDHMRLAGLDVQVIMSQPRGVVVTIQSKVKVEQQASAPAVTAKREPLSEVRKRGKKRKRSTWLPF